MKINYLILLLSTLLFFGCSMWNSRAAVELNHNATMLIATYGDNVDSLQKAVDLLSQAIELTPRNNTLYGQKAQTLGRLLKLDDALAVLEDCEKRAGISTEHQLLRAMILHYTGQEAAASSFYDSVITDYQTQMKKISKGSPEYDALLFNYVLAIKMRYENDEALQYIECLKSQNDYNQIFTLLSNLENIDKKRYLEWMICGDTIEQYQQ